ncbi:MMPL family transporter [Streptomyces iconiensis]|uniref:MMPL family transporter n=1 Tax=Streptomyces iconiensis TaxID=1384038 RepID=A0ABT6ZRP4_9ACTN|nr:MMPL family transporter [Streptomyces iconiensis]MDJ1131532.1 MMPL family transporter [Streptomyces iconiensis]
MLERLAGRLVRRPRRILLGVLVVVLAVGGLSMGLTDRLTMGGYENPGTEAAHAEKALEGEFGRGRTNLVLVVEDRRGVDDPAVAAAGRRLAGNLAKDHVSGVASYWTAGKAASLRGSSRERALVTGHIAGDFDQVNDRVEKLRDDYTGSVHGVRVTLGGSALMNLENTEQAAEDAATAETLVFPLVLVVLVLIFGSLVAAMLPLAVALATMLVVFGLMWGLTFVFDANNLLVNTCTFLGLGLAIDYSLLFVTRYREELASGRHSLNGPHGGGPHTAEGGTNEGRASEDGASALGARGRGAGALGAGGRDAGPFEVGTSEVRGAILAAMRTVGRTVIFSAVTLALACMSLVVMPFGMFRSIAIGGAVTALAAALATLIIVPALLAWAGPRIDRLRIGRLGVGRFRIDRLRIRARRRPGAAVNARVGEGGWHRLALLVMRRPVSMVLGVLALMAVLAAPALDLNLRLPDEQVLPKSAQSARAAQLLQDDFDGRETETLGVVAREARDSPKREAAVAAYAKRLSSLDGVRRVDALTGSYVDGQRVAPAGAGAERFATDKGVYWSVVPSVDGLSDAGADVVTRVREAESPYPVLVGGPPAVSADTFASAGDRLPLVVGILALGTYVLLFLLTGSVLLPLAAMLLSVLSLSATFGALVFVFQDGHLQWLVGDFVNTGALNWTVPVMIAVLAFGLSMDYAVFILSRVREEYTRTGDARGSVAVGLERVGRVITYAAIVLSLTFIVMLTSGISYMKALGLGVPLAILLDATLIRGILLPAFMRLLGRACWWAPAPLRRLHARFGLSESGPRG